MNVAISTFVRRGYLLTALAVAVLLAGFSGTAWAQTTGVSTTATSRFSGSSGTLPEGADLADLSKPRPLKVTIRRTPKSSNDPYNTSTPAVGHPAVGPAANRRHLSINFEQEDGTPGLPPGITVTAPDQSVTAVTEGVALTFQPSDKTREEKTGLKVVHPDDTEKEEEDQRQVDGPPHIVTIAKSEIVLTFQDDRLALYSDSVGTKVNAGEDGDWLTEKFVMTVTKHEELGAATKSAGTKPYPFVNDFTSSKFTVNIDDDDPQPVFKFNDTNILLAEGSEQTVMVGVGTIGDGGEEGSLRTGDGGIADKLATLTTSDDPVLLSVSPAAALGPADDGDDADDDDDKGIISIQFGDDEVDIFRKADAQGRYDIGTIAGAVTADGRGGIDLKITVKDVTGFRDERVTLTLMDGRTPEQKADDGGGIEDSAPATVTILSSKETPTVTFSTDSIDIDEGDKETVHLLAGGMQGDEVGAVTVAVRGDALISLEQNGSPIGGTVSFGGNANAELTIVANSDPSLEDGEEKTATVSITNAGGALIGDPNTVTVTVVGSTAVPVLPLLGQLLLALLLMVGGARLYRRHQG